MPVLGMVGLANTCLKSRASSWDVVLDSEYYENFSEADDSNRHMAGVFETFCLSKKKVIMGLTFFDWMIRGLINKYSDVNHTPFDQLKHESVEEMTSHTSETVQQVILNYHYTFTFPYRKQKNNKIISNTVLGSKK